VTTKVPATYGPDNIKVRIYKNTVVITGRKETETTVRVFHKTVPISGTINPQEKPVATVTPNGLLTLNIRTVEVTETRVQKQVVEEKRVTKTEQATNETQETTVTKIQPEISNEVVQLDSNLTKNIVQIEKGKQFNVSTSEYLFYLIFNMLQCYCRKTMSFNEMYVNITDDF